MAISFGSVTLGPFRLRQGVPATIQLPEATGGNPPYHYVLSGNPPGMRWDRANRRITGTPNTAQAARQYTWIAFDNDYRDQENLHFYIEVYAYTGPNFGDETISDLDLRQNTAITPVTLPAATGGEGTLVYSLAPALPPGLSFNATTRILSGTPTALLTTARTYTYGVADGTGESAELTFTIRIRAPDTNPTFGQQTISNQNLIRDTAMTPVTLPLATGGNAPLVYTLTPAPPAGVQLDLASRRLSGTPTAVTTARTYSWRVVDEDGDAAELQFQISVGLGPPPTFGQQTISNIQIVLNAALTPRALPAATGGTGALRYDISGLPSGITFDAATRRLSGTAPGVTGTASVIYTVTDTEDRQARLTFLIDVVERDVQPTFGGARINDLTLATGTAMTPRTLPQATSGNGAITYRITPDLPHGILFDSATRVLSGTPTRIQAATTYTYTATDVDGDSVSLQFQITVPELQPIFDPSARAQVTDLSLQATVPMRTVTLPEARSGNPPLAYFLRPDLPHGILFDSATRVLSGTPTRIQAATTYTYTATDFDGDAAAITFIIEVAAAPARPETPDSGVALGTSSSPLPPDDEQLFPLAAPYGQIAGMKAPWLLGSPAFFSDISVPRPLDPAANPGSGDPEVDVHDGGAFPRPRRRTQRPTVPPNRNR